MANLFEIDRAIVDAWEACVDPETGEINEDLYADFEALQMERDRKIENIACWVKNLKSDAAAMKEEAKNMTERAKAAEAKAARLQDYVGRVLNGQPWHGTRAAISWRTSHQLSIDEGATVPAEYMRIKTTSEPDKTALKAAIAAGKEFEGIRVLDVKNMTIK